MKFIAILGVLFVLASCSDSDVEYSYHGTTIECLLGTYKLIDDSRVEETSYNSEDELYTKIIDVIKINDYTFEKDPKADCPDGIDKSFLSTCWSEFNTRLNFKDKTILYALDQSFGDNKPEECKGMITPEMLRDIDWDAN
tara:strand:- start:24 stop:443 length:420 start_codon:yes stop_codon:yes gene_type:complete